MDFFTGSPLFRPPCSPLSTGCRFAILALLFWVMTACNSDVLPASVLKSLVSGSPETAPIFQVSPTAFSLPNSSATANRSALVTPSLESNPRHNQVQTTPEAFTTAALPTPTNTRLPKVSSDLLYLSEGSLMRWDRVTLFSSRLVDNVESYSADASGMKIVLLRPRRVAQNGNELFDLDLLDLSTKQIENLIQETERLHSLILSPNGKYLAYQNSHQGRAIEVIEIESPASSIELGECIQTVELECSGLAWSPDSHSLLWNDSRGIWTGKPLDKPGRQILKNQVSVTDPAGQSSQFQAYFSNLQWSPQGRFVLLVVSPVNSDVSWHAVLDTLTGRLQHLMDSYETSPEQANVEWLRDGTLAVARASDPTSGHLPVIQIWSVFPTNPNLLVALQQYEPFSDLDSGVDLQTSQNDQQKLCLDWFYQQQDGYLLFGAILEGTFNQPALFDLKMSNGTLTPLAQLDPDTEHVIWAPDGSGLLVIGRNGQVLYSSLNGQEVYDLRQIFGADAHDFHWLPPAPRS